MTKIVNPSVGGVPDEAWTEVDVSGLWTNLFTGGLPFFLGTNGTSVLRYTRIGRTVFVKGQIQFDTDHEDGIFTLDATQLPYLNEAPGVSIIAWASDFSYAVFPETTPGANDGRLEPLGAIIAPFGGSSGGLGFIQMSRNNTDGGLGNLFQTTTPFAGSGRQFYCVFSFYYEADDVA